MKSDNRSGFFRPIMPGESKSQCLHSEVGWRIHHSVSVCVITKNLTSEGRKRGVFETVGYRLLIL